MRIQVGEQVVLKSTRVKDKVNTTIDKNDNIKAKKGDVDANGAVSEREVYIIPRELPALEVRALKASLAEAISVFDDFELGMEEAGQEEHEEQEKEEEDDDDDDDVVVKGEIEEEKEEDVSVYDADDQDQVQYDAIKSAYPFL